MEPTDNFTTNGNIMSENEAELSSPNPFKKRFNQIDIQSEPDSAEIKLNDAQEKQNSNPELNFNFKCHGKSFLKPKTSFFIFSDTNPFRKAVFWIVEWKWFQFFMTIVILANTAILAQYDYSIRVNPNLDSIRNDLQDSTEILFTVIFGVEFLLKAIAYGFILGKGSYLKDSWNILDFIVVITAHSSILGTLPGLPNLTAIRAVRVLRPLRSINTLEGMKHLVTCLLKSLPALGNVALFLFFLIVLFSILGLQLFIDREESRCRTTPAPVNGLWLADPSITNLCGGDFSCPSSSYCGNPADYNLVQNWTETTIPELIYGIPNYNNILNATLTVFQSLTTEGWSANMYMYNHGYLPAVNTIFYCFIIIFGAFYVVNLILAVINESFLNQADHSHNDKHNGEGEGNKTFDSKDDSIIETPKNSKFFSDNLANSSPGLSRKTSDLVRKSSFGVRKEFNISSSPGLEGLKSPTGNPFWVPERVRKNKVLAFFYRVVTSNWFMACSLVLILMNTITLSMDEYPISKSKQNTLDTINIVLTVAFFFEMTLRIIGFGIKDYVRDRFNLFDSIIVLLGIIEVIMVNFAGISIGLNVLTGFRLLRLFRLFKLARSWGSLRLLIQIFIAAIPDIKNFLVLVILFVIISSLLGQELFAYRIFINGVTPRFSFNSFFDGLILVFTLLTNEEWNLRMYEGMISQGPIVSLYYVAVLIIGNYILLKLFLAILLSDFEALSKAETKPSSIKKMFKKLKDKSSKIKESIVRKISMKSNSKDRRDSIDSGNENVNNSRRGSNAIVPALNLPEDGSPTSGIKLNPISLNSNNAGDGSDSYRASNHMESNDRKDLSTLFSMGMMGSQIDRLLVGNSLFMFSPRNPFRRLIAKITLHSYFEWVIVFMILFSSITLAIDNPFDDPESATQNTLEVIDLITTIIFTLEIIFKVITFGLMFNGSNSFIFTFWNILDLLVVTISWVIFGVGSSSSSGAAALQKIKVLRTLRVLRPLRLISRNEGFKVALTSIISAVPVLINLLLVCLLFFLLFGIIGVNYLKGTFFYCDMAHIPASYTANIATKLDCLNYGGDWVNSDYNFDNVANALQLLFVVSTTEGWIEIMQSATDSVGIDLQPIQDYQKAWQLYFVFFIVIGSFFLTNIFAGVLVDTFNREKDRLDGMNVLTNDQKEWVHLKLAMLKIKPHREFKLSKNPHLVALRKIVDHHKFEIFITSCVILNMIVFALTWSRQEQAMSDALNYVNYTFLGIFTIEAILKIIGYGFTYFKDGWNIFDFAIVLTSIISLIIDNLVGGLNLGSSTSVIRTFRVGRILRLVNKAQSLRTIFNTILITIPAMANIGGLLLLTLFVFSVLGINLFPFVKLQSTLNEDSNFQSFGSSFIGLLKISTGENWNILMKDTSRNVAPNFACVDVNTYEDYLIYGVNGCGTWIASIFFIVFQVIFALILLNLFIAIILEAFDESAKSEMAKIKSSDYDEFKAQWKKYDPDDIDKFLIQLKPPIGDKKFLIRAERVKFILRADFQLYSLPDREGYFYQFNDILLQLAKNYIERVMYVGIDQIPPKGAVRIQKEIEKVQKEHSKRSEPSKITSGQLRAGLLILKAVNRLKDKVRVSRKRKTMMIKTNVDESENTPNNQATNTDRNPATNPIPINGVHTPITKSPRPKSPQTKSPLLPKKKLQNEILIEEIENANTFETLNTVKTPDSHGEKVEHAQNILQMLKSKTDPLYAPVNQNIDSPLTNERKTRAVDILDKLKNQTKKEGE